MSLESFDPKSDDDRSLADPKRSSDDRGIRAGLSRRGRLAVWGALLVAGIAAFWMLPVAEWVVAGYQWIRSLGQWAFLTFVMIFTVLSMAGLPTSPLNVGAGLLFGLLYGFIAALVGATLASVLCFLIARYVARDWVLRRACKSPRFTAVLKGLRTESWKLILLTRLNPLLPAALASYCFGVTPIRFGQYTLATIVGNIPLCFVLAYLGSVGQLAISRREWSVWDYVLYGVGLLATIAMTVWLTYYTRRKLNQYAKSSGDRQEQDLETAARGCGLE